MTACAYAEGALLNGTTTIFCDSHEIGNVFGERGVEWMLEDARRAPLSIFLTVPSTVRMAHDPSTRWVRRDHSYAASASAIKPVALSAIADSMWSQGSV